MKSKTFILFALIAYFISGCQVGSYVEKEEIIVSKILKSQQTLYSASRQSDRLSSSYILYHDNYTYHSNQVDDILSLQLHVGNLTLQGYGYGRFLLSDLLLDFDLDTLNDDYIYDYEGYIYDTYHDRYHFSTTIPFVGNANQLPYKGIMQIIGRDETIVVSVIDDYYVDIAIYDNYNSYHDRVIHTTWHSLGF
jgi:hypothetical protein